MTTTKGTVLTEGMVEVPLPGIGYDQIDAADYGIDATRDATCGVERNQKSGCNPRRDQGAIVKVASQVSRMLGAVTELISRVMPGPRGKVAGTVHT